MLKKFGKVDILVNNAGATWGAPAEDHPLEAWDKLVNLNLTGVFVLTQSVGKNSMIPREMGRVINVASIAGLMGQDPRIVRTIAYNATKGGLVNFTRALAAEWGQHGITVNAICPGFFPSRMTSATLGTTGELIRDWTPTRRLGNDEDLKGLAVLLASRPRATSPARRSRSTAARPSYERQGTRSPRRETTRSASRSSSISRSRPTSSARARRTLPAGRASSSPTAWAPRTAA